MSREWMSITFMNLWRKQCTAQPNSSTATAAVAHSSW